MLENLSETKSRMQADELGEVVLCKDTEQFPIPEMTYKIVEPREEPLLEETSIVGSNTKFGGINLEDDIEKVEVTSHESSSSDEEETSNAECPTDLETNVFNDIPTQNSSESIKHWLQRITDMQHEIQKKYGHSSTGTTSTISTKANASLTSTTTASTPLNSSRVVKYQDLPYMGEITLDNSKPRRGRKPKKADICHLIYKNYGTIFPGTPNPSSYLEKDSHSRKNPLTDRDFVDTDSNRIDVQNRIISSLLEKRLTQEYSSSKESKTSHGKASNDQNEPLNLCIRDLNHLKIRLMKNNDNTYSKIKSEPHSDDDADHPPSPSLNIKIDSKAPSTPDELSTPSPDPARTPEGSTAPGGYVYWPNAGVFIHPAALQQQLLMYQRMTGNNSYILPNSQSPKISSEGSPPIPKLEGGAQQMRKLVPKVVKPKPIYSKENVQETDTHSLLSQSTKKRTSHSENSTKTPAKRKRSAIFIPPIPTESTNNSATEVSICKFKFTGGAKPSLQEKKMLSVDSGGNFRYYSGTGDKSMRGYEFFPRETLQQQINNTHGSSTGAFLQASGEKIYPTPPPDFISGKPGSDFLLSPDLPAVSYRKGSMLSPESHSQKHKKRKSRKSLQREKLEQTFKEKGFLIQTQQTESAEGATYCKFRQLRKFTRYLFRSWKDYLPGNIAEGDQAIPNTPENGESSLTHLSKESNDNLSGTSSELSPGNT